MEAANTTPNLPAALASSQAAPDSDNDAPHARVVDVNWIYASDAIFAILVLFTVVGVIVACFSGIALHHKKGWPAITPLLLVAPTLLPIGLYVLWSRRRLKATWQKALSGCDGARLEVAFETNAKVRNAASRLGIYPKVFAEGLARAGYVNRLVRLQAPAAKPLPEASGIPFAFEAVPLCETDPAFRNQLDALWQHDGVSNRARLSPGRSAFRAFLFRWSAMLPLALVLIFQLERALSRVPSGTHSITLVVVCAGIVALVLRGWRLLLWKACAAPGALTYRALLRHRCSHIYLREESVLVFLAPYRQLVASNGRDTTVFHLTPLEAEFAMRAWLSDVGRPSEAQLRQLLDGD